MRGSFLWLFVVQEQIRDDVRLRLVVKYKRLKARKRVEKCVKNSDWFREIRIFDGFDSHRLHIKNRPKNQDFQ